MRLQVISAYQSTFSSDDIGDRDFVPARIGPADHAALGDTGMIQENALNLGRIDVLAAGDDQVLLAVMDPEITICIAAADIARAIPAVVQGFASCGFVSPIFEEDVGTTYRDLA